MPSRCFHTRKTKRATSDRGGHTSVARTVRGLLSDDQPRETWVEGLPFAIPDGDRRWSSRLRQPIRTDVPKKRELSAVWRNTLSNRRNNECLQSREESGCAEPSNRSSKAVRSRNGCCRLIERTVSISISASRTPSSAASCPRTRPNGSTIRLPPE